MNEEANEAPVIFVTGIMQRSGTHFLANLLCKHADCEKSGIPEDCFLLRADYLLNYGVSLKRAWDKWRIFGNG